MQNINRPDEIVQSFMVRCRNKIQLTRDIHGYINISDGQLIEWKKYYLAYVKPDWVCKACEDKKYI